MSTNAAFMNSIKNGLEIEPDENVFKTIWSEYERVIIESIITSFGLDFIVKDQVGGDVDTIHNVRNLKDEKENTIYKNLKNQQNYDNRSEWDKKLSDSFYQDERYKRINAKVATEKKNGTLVDSYTGKTVKRNEDIDLDHVIAKKEIYDDPGRVLAGLDAKDLANCDENLRPTNRSINRSMKDKNLSEYADYLEATRGERQARIKELSSKKNLSDKERKQLNKLQKLEEGDPQLMKQESEKARKAYETKLSRAYYTSPKFVKDMAVAAGKTGAKMGLRQVLGFVFTEVWFCAKEEIQKIKPGTKLKEMIISIGEGIKKGFESACKKYKELLAKFGEGLTSGVLSSLTTTLCNIFFTTAKNLVKCVRQIYASIVQAGKILLFNPDNLMMGDRVKSATIIIATGASVLVGTVVGDLISKTPIGLIPVVGEITQVFCSSLVSGVLSCTLLVFLDRSKFMNCIIDCLNAIPSEVGNYEELADTLERLAAKLENIDIEKFSVETNKFKKIATEIVSIENENDMNRLLLSVYKEFDFKIPWEGGFDSFMSDKSNRLVFE